MTTIRMPVEAVRRHSTTVDGISADVSTAHKAASQVYLDSAAFGQLCQFLPAVFEPVLNTAVDAIDAASTSLKNSSEKLRSATSGTESTDIAAASRFEAVPNGIDLPL